MRIIYRKIRHARYLHIKRNIEKVWGARYTLGARYLSQNTVIAQTANILICIILTTGRTLRDRIPVGTRFSAHPDRPWGPPSIL